MTTDAILPATDAQSSLAANAEVRRLQVGCWITLIAIAVVRGWFTRYEFDGDSVAYLDIGSAIAEGHPSAAIHAYWAPGYPVLLSFFLWLFRPNAYWECPLAHFVNVMIFVGVLASFQMFWSEVRVWHENDAGNSGLEIPGPAFWALGYSIFGIAALNVITVALVGPDLLLAGFCCMAGWSALRFRLAPSTGRALLLGVVLGLGYYAKSPFFPMGFVFIFCACFKPHKSGRALLLGGSVLIAYLLVCAPFVAAISFSKGRFTFGESARLSQAFYINGVEYYEHWQGGPPGSGMPLHPTRKLNDHPEIYEFAVRNMGTYPAWFDPSYWYEGVTPHFNSKLQTKVFLANLILEFQIIVESGTELACAAIVLALLTSYSRRWTERFWRLWFMWVPGAIALSMFALVHVEPRFLGGWLIMLFGGVICASVLPGDKSTSWVVTCLGLAVLVTAGAALISQASREAIGIDHALGRSSRDASIAVFLLNNGLHPDDDVALIGNGFEVYWAHLARLHVVAEIPANIRSNQAHPALDFWESGLEQQQNALRVFQRIGVKAIIADPQNAVAGSVPSIVPAPWKEISQTGAFVYFFPASR